MTTQALTPPTPEEAERAALASMIETSKNGLVISSEIIAKGAGVEHRAVLQLIGKHQPKIERFGLLTFEMRARPAGQHGGGDVRIALLNEHQSTFLLTMMRNTEQVLDFKANLVEAFFKMAESMNRGAELTPEQLMAKALVQAQQILESSKKELEAARPAVEYHNRYVSNEDAIIVRDFAAEYGMTSIQMYKLLRDKKIVYKTTVTEHFSKKQKRVVQDNEHRAYAKYLKYFDLRPQNDIARYHNGQVRKTLYVRQAHALELAKIIGLETPTHTTKELF